MRGGDEEIQGRNMEMFDDDLEIAMDGLRGMLDHYSIGDWEAYILVRKAGCAGSYVIKYAADSNVFAERLRSLHVSSVPIKHEFYQPAADNEMCRRCGQTEDHAIHFAVAPTKDLL